MKLHSSPSSETGAFVCGWRDGQTCRK